MSNDLDNLLIDMSVHIPEEGTDTWADVLQHIYRLEVSHNVLLDQNTTLKSAIQLVMPEKATEEMLDSMQLDKFSMIDPKYREGSDLHGVGVTQSLKET